MNQAIYDHLAYLYGNGRSAQLTDRLEALITRYRPQLPPPQTGERFSERDAILITYGDQIQTEGEAPLRTLAGFLRRRVRGNVNGVHILPFYPYSSDDGFSVIDYKAVDPHLGNWGHIQALGADFRLMFDAVINHISAQSDWFQRFLADAPRYRDYFTVVDPAIDLSAVFRPRALPLLTEVETAVGPKHVWTTFSPDQIDLNYANPDVLLHVLDVLLFYVAQGAEFIRLDAIAFMWKEIGTSCIHLPQTHRIIQLMRSVLDVVAPQVILITETNVPHQENISYFGDGANEAQLVYNFSLPPLTLHSFHTGSAATLSRWADRLTLPSPQVTFFNFLASHDGIGVTPARGILSDVEIDAMAQRVQSLGGFVSGRSMPDGSQIAYELNINYLDALGDPEHPDEPTAFIARRFLASQAIMLALRGVPGIYFHSLFGSRGWPQGVQETGRFRTINRQKLDQESLEQELANPNSLRHRVFHGYRRLLRQRTHHPAFHPNGGQQVIFGADGVFSLLRTDPAGETAVLCLHNITPHPQPVTINLAPLPVPHRTFADLLSDEAHTAKGDALSLTLPPYGVAWLAGRDD